MEDADETVGESAEGLVVGLATRPMGVVVAPSSWRPSQRRVPPAEASIDEVAIRATRASTVRRVPEARVIGAVPA